MASWGWSDTGTEPVWRWDRAAHLLATSHNQFLQPLCLSHSFSDVEAEILFNVVTSGPRACDICVVFWRFLKHLRKRYCELMDLAGARQGWIRQGLVVLDLSLLFLVPSHVKAHALTFPKNSHWLLRIQKFIMARKTWSIQPEFSYIFRGRCYLYNVFHKILFSRERVSTEGEALELLLFHLCSIATVIPTPPLPPRFPKSKLKILLHWSWGGSFGNCISIPMLESQIVPGQPHSCQGKAQVCHGKLPRDFQGSNGT